MICDLTYNLIHIIQIKVQGIVLEGKCAERNINATGKNTVNTRKGIFLLFVLFLLYEGRGKGDKNETQSPSLFWDIRRY